MESSAQRWTCSKCGTPIEPSAIEPRQPCPTCGSLARTAHVSVHDTLHVSAYLKTHAKHREGGRKVVREVIAGDDYHHKSGKWNIMRRVIDRMNDWYEETFKERHSGEVIHHTAEPLTDHRRPPKRRVGR
jgi:predicted RNA-binding Zn-ribbon protein involved in translation (DUF1610 family)